MNIKSKIVSLSIVTALTLTITGQSFAAAAPFTDLANVPQKQEILVLQEKGYVAGVGNKLFAPNATITAAQGIQLIVNALGLNIDLIRFFKEPKATDYFKNADNDAWYANALIIAAMNGLELSKDIDMNQGWTREEFTHRLILAMETHANLPKIKLVPAQFADQEQIIIGYEGSVQRALVYGVIKLDAEGNLNPKGKISRAEAAEEIYNALNYINVHKAPEKEAAPVGRGTVLQICATEQNPTILLDGTKRDFSAIFSFL
jgi:hypothetical protein